MLISLDEKYVKKRLANWKFEESKIKILEDKDNSNDSWYCFVPNAISKPGWLSKRLLPREGKRTICTISALNLMDKSPEKTVKNLDGVYDPLFEEMEKDIREGKDISFVGVSIGNVLSIRAASELPRGRVKNLISFVGGGRLGISAWDSILVQHLARASGCNSAEEYEERVKKFSPLEYMDDLSVDSIFARFGTSDLLIRYNPNGKELRNAFEESVLAKKKNIRTYTGADHVSTMLLTSLENVYR